MALPIPGVTPAPPQRPKIGPWAGIEPWLGKRPPEQKPPTPPGTPIAGIEPWLPPGGPVLPDLSERAKVILGSWQSPTLPYQKTFKEFAKWQTAHTKKYPGDVGAFQEIARFLAGVPAPSPAPTPAPGAPSAYREPGPVQIPIPPTPMPITPPPTFQPQPWQAPPMPTAPPVMTPPTPPAPVALTPPPAFEAIPYQEKPFGEYITQAQAQYGPLAEAARQKLMSYQKEAADRIVRDMAARNILPSGLTQENLERLAGDVAEQLTQVELESQGQIGARAGELQTQEFGRYMNLRQQGAVEAAQRFTEWATKSGMDINQQQQLFTNQMAQAGFSKDESQRAFTNALNIRQQGFVEYTTEREMGLAENAQKYQQWATTTGMSIDQAQQLFTNQMLAEGFNQQEIQRVFENERRKLEFEKTQSLQEKLAKMGYAQQTAELAAQQQYWGGQLGLGYAQLSAEQAWRQQQLAAAGGAGAGVGVGDWYAYTSSQPATTPGPGKLGQAITGRLGVTTKPKVTIPAPTRRGSMGLGKAVTSAAAKAKGRTTAKAATKAPYGLASAAAKKITTLGKIARA